MFVPVYHFNGNYHGYWTGKESKRVEEISSGKSYSKTVWEPVSGTVTGNFSLCARGCNKENLEKLMPGLKLLHNLDIWNVCK